MQRGNAIPSIGRGGTLRRWAGWSAALALALSAAACAPQQAKSSDEPAEQGPVKVGLILPLSGNLAAAGQDAKRGWELFWKEHPDGAGGREVQALIEDYGTQPETALTKARSMVQKDQVAAIFDAISGNTSKALADYLATTSVPMLLPISSEDDITQRDHVPNIIRMAGWTGSQATHALGDWAAKQGYKRVLTLCADYSFGHENCGGFVNTFTDAGGVVVEQLWNPLGTQDFAPYMAKIKSADVDVVFATEVGGDAPKFLQAWKSFGLKDTVPLLTNSSVVDQSTIRNLKGDVTEGVIAAEHFSTGRDHPATKEFVAKYQDAYGELPSFYAAAMYTGAQWFHAALEANGGKAAQEPLLKAIREVSLDDSIMGPMTLDHLDNPVFDVYIDQVTARPDGDGYWAAPIATIPQVSQFWTYDEKEYLEHPPYSRTYQGNGVWPEPLK